MSANFQGQPGTYVTEDTRWMWPMSALAVTHADLTGGEATEAEALPTLPTNSIPLDSYFYNKTAWTVGGGTSTALSVQIGDAGNTDECMGETPLVGASADLWLATRTNGAWAISNVTTDRDADADAPPGDAVLADLIGTLLVDLTGLAQSSRMTGVVEASAYAPIATFTASGGTPDAGHADAGEGIAVVYYHALPSGSKLWELLGETL